MKKFALISVLALVASCAEDRSREYLIDVDGTTFNVYPDRKQPHKWHAWPAERSINYRPPPRVRLKNVQAIEAVSGCPAILETIYHLDGIFTSASVSC